MTHFRPLIFFLFIVSALISLAGCAEPAPKLMPAAPIRVERGTDGGEERGYDSNRDGKADYFERLGRDGRVVLLRLDLDGDEKIDLEVDRAVHQVHSAGGRDRQLVVILDSIPFGMVRDLYEQGRFRLFYPPSRTIPPFPVMTDLALAEFFGTSPSPAVEAQFYRRSKLTDGFDTYAHERNANWLSHVDYYMPFLVHSVAYLWPYTWFDHEMGNIQRMFFKGHSELFIGYSVSPSCLGSFYGRDGHQGGLVRLDRFCQKVMQQLRGRVQITLMSDHGHKMVRSRRIPLRRVLRDMGYHVVTSLKGPQDVAVPEFGMVNCAAIYTHRAPSVARDLLGIEGIEQTAYLADSGEVVVGSRNGRARITSDSAGYRYDCEFGDPLEMRPVIESLRAKGAVDAKGFVEDRALFEATVDHTYPDAIHRLWRAFHGLVENQPDVLISVKDGWHCGSSTLALFMQMAATHGNLRHDSSGGFVMSTLGTLPPVLRIAELHAEMEKLGVPFNEASENQNAKMSQR